MKIEWNAARFGLVCLAVAACGTAAATEGAEKATSAVAAVQAAAQKPARDTSDRELARRVENALDADPYVYTEHVTVTSKDGVVTLSGMVGSEWDLATAIGISDRVPGVKRVVDGLEIWEFGGRAY
jgi:osmotically-inducible protein OsmY